MIIPRYLMWSVLSREGHEQSEAEFGETHEWDVMVKEGGGRRLLLCAKVMYFVLETLSVKTLSWSQLQTMFGVITEKLKANCLYWYQKSY